MGNSGSTSSVTNEGHYLTEFLAQSFIKNNQICQTSVSASQVINASCDYSPAEEEAKSSSWACKACMEKATNVKDCLQFCSVDCSYSDINQNAVLSFSGNCQVDAKATQDLQAKIMNDIQQAQENKQDSIGMFLNALVPGNNQSVANTLDIKNKVSQIFSVETTQKILNQMVAMQQINLKAGTVNGVHQTIAITMVQTTIESTSAGQQLVVEADTVAKLTQHNVQQTALSDLFDTVGGIFGSYGGQIMLVIIALGAVYFVYENYGSSDSDSGSGGRGGGGRRGGRRISPEELEMAAEFA